MGGQGVSREKKGKDGVEKKAKAKVEEKKERPSRPLKRKDPPKEEGEGEEEEEEETEEETETEDLDEDIDELSLLRQAGEIQRKLEAIVGTNEDLSKFVADYDRNAHLFTNTYAFSHQNPSSAPNYTSLSPHDLDVLLQEMEPDIREAASTLQTISQLDQRGVTGAGKLENYEPLLGRMSELVKKSKEDVVRLEALESRVWKLVEGYGGRVDLKSRLFVEWSDLVGEVDGRVAKLEKQKEGRANMGLE
ncbi:hypothetical protein CPB86DRAFT_784207 [Serendipita vermifera]|nr:hypothetical protein CPB86DRAFT_784207 [Serendipita vermifera]